MKFKGTEEETGRHPPFLKFFPAVMLLFVLTAFPLFSQSSLHIDVYPGFNGAFTLSNSVPVRIRIRNEGPGIDGEVFLQTTGEEGNLVSRMVRPVSLPAGSDKEVFFLAGLNSTSLGLEAGFSSGGVARVEKTLHLGRRRYTRPMIVVTGPPGSFDFLLGLPAIREGAFPVVYAHPEDLPTKSRGYDGVQILLLHDIPLGEIDGRRAAALAEWTDSGGTLVVSFGGNPGFIPGGDYPLRQLLPVSLAGIGSKTDGGYIPAVITAEGKDFLPVSEDRGEGLIVFVPFKADTTTLGTGGVIRFWTGILSEALQPVEDPPVFTNPGNLTERILEAGLQGFPGRKKALAAGGGLFLLGAAALGLLRTAGRRPAAAVYCGLILLSTAAGGLLFYHPGKGPEPLAASFSYIRGSSERSFADVQTAVSLFSPSPVKAGMHIPDEAVPVDVDTPYTLRYGERTVLEHLPLRGWDRRNLIFTSRVPLPLRFHTHAAGLTVENIGAANLEDAVLYRGGLIYPVGDIPAGGMAVVSSQGVPPKPGLWLPQELLSSLSGPRREIYEEAFKDPAFLSFLADTSALFVGWMEAPPFASLVPEGWLFYHQELVLVTVGDEGSPYER